jgi:hypothetical protein
MGTFDNLYLNRIKQLQEENQQLRNFLSKTVLMEEIDPDDVTHQYLRATGEGKFFLDPKDPDRSRHIKHFGIRTIRVDKSGNEVQMRDRHGNRRSEWDSARTNVPDQMVDHPEHGILDVRHKGDDVILTKRTDLKHKSIGASEEDVQKGHAPLFKRGSAQDSNFDRLEFGKPEFDQAAAAGEVHRDRARGVVRPPRPGRPYL